MAGLQSCLRNVILNNNLRLLYKNSLLLQVSRGKHLLSVGIPAIKCGRSCNNSIKLLVFDLKNISKFNSTSAAVSEKLTNVSPPASSDRVNSEVVENSSASAEAVLPLNGTDDANLSFDKLASSEQQAFLVQQSSSDQQASLSSEIVIDDSLLPDIPKQIPEPIAVDWALSQSNISPSGVIEPTFSSLGLNSYWPSGWIQTLLEFLHMNFDLPWWAAIGLVTLIMKTITFPLNIKARRNAILMHNHLPEIQKIQAKIQESKKTGNYYETANHMSELHQLLKKNEIVGFGSIMPQLAQIPIFLSFFYALKGMVNLPVPSLMDGGLLWFKDLSVPDPYFILPLILATSMLAIIELGSEGTSTQIAQKNWVKYIFRAVPLMILPFSMRFAGAIQCYWVMSNFIALSQSLILRIPAVKIYFNIPENIKHDPSKLIINKKNPIEEIKESISSMKIIREIDDRERLNTITFKNAGVGPIPRTFKKDPTAKLASDSLKLRGK